MHFTISPLGSAGDVHPFLGLALKLQRRGHDISFVTTGYFEEAVVRHGLHYVELGTRAEFLDAVDNPQLWSQTRSFAHIFESIASIYRRHYELLQKQHKEQPTVAISSCLGFGARIAQEKLGIPLVSVHLQPAVIVSKTKPPMLSGYTLPNWFSNSAIALGEKLVIDRIACPKLNEFRAELGLPPMCRLLSWWHSNQINVGLFPEWFAVPQDDWPANTQLADFPLWDDNADQDLAPDVQQFLDDGDPPVVFTPGSANKFGEKFFATAVGACSMLGQRGIFLSRFDQHVPKNLPPEIRHFDYVPLGPLLTRAAAIVHHGGIGTTAQALAAGRPQLIMALAHDQFDNGARVVRLGVGKWLYPQQFHIRAVAKRLSKLLESPEVALACKQTSHRLLRRDGLDQAADVIESFAGSTFETSN